MHIQYIGRSLYIYIYIYLFKSVHTHSYCSLNRYYDLHIFRNIKYLSETELENPNLSSFTFMWIPFVLSNWCTYNMDSADSSEISNNSIFSSVVRDFWAIMLQLSWYPMVCTSGSTVWWFRVLLWRAIPNQTTLMSIDMVSDLRDMVLGEDFPDWS